MISIRVLIEAPIIVRGADDQPTHAPMAQATIGGTPTRLILDTGSTDHLLTMELAAQIGLEATEGEAGTDSTGSSVASWSLGEVPVDIGEQTFTLANVIGINGPPPFIAKGIGAIVSPQPLPPPAWAVLDLSAERFYL